MQENRRPIQFFVFLFYVIFTAEIDVKKQKNNWDGGSKISTKWWLGMGLVIFFLPSLKFSLSKSWSPAILSPWCFHSFLNHFLQSWALFSSFSEPVHLMSNFLKIGKVLVVYFWIYFFKNFMINNCKFQTFYEFMCFIGS